MFPQIENKINYLINGIEKDGYTYCSTARQYEKNVWRKRKNV